MSNILVANCDAVLYFHEPALSRHWNVNVTCARCCLIAVQQCRSMCGTVTSPTIGIQSMERTAVLPLSSCPACWNSILPLWNTPLTARLSVWFITSRIVAPCILEWEQLSSWWILQFNPRCPRDRHASMPPPLPKHALASCRTQHRSRDSKISKPKFLRERYALKLSCIGSCSHAHSHTSARNHHHVRSAHVCRYAGSCARRHGAKQDKINHKTETNEKKINYDVENTVAKNNMHVSVCPRSCKKTVD